MPHGISVLSIFIYIHIYINTLFEIKMGRFLAICFEEALGWVFKKIKNKRKSSHYKKDKSKHHLHTQALELVIYNSLVNL